MVKRMIALALVGLMIASSGCVVVRGGRGRGGYYRGGGPRVHVVHHHRGC